MRDKQGRVTSPNEITVLCPLHCSLWPVCSNLSRQCFSSEETVSEIWAKEGRPSSLCHGEQLAPRVRWNGYLGTCSEV